MRTTEWGTHSNPKSQESVSESLIKNLSALLRHSLTLGTIKRILVPKQV
jgi:hypothetical protein